MAAGGGRVGYAVAQLCVNRLQTTIKIAIDVAIPKSKDTKACCRKTSVTSRVWLLMPVEIVLPAIEFNDKAMLHANKVDDVSFKRRLPPEMITAPSP